MIKLSTTWCMFGCAFSNLMLDDLDFAKLILVKIKCDINWFVFGNRYLKQKLIIDLNMKFSTYHKSYNFSLLVGSDVFLEAKLILIMH